jgi:hypothetical protein
VQPVSFLLAHLDSFHLLTSRVRIGTFYLALIGTSHVAATISVVGYFEVNSDVRSCPEAISLRQNDRLESCGVVIGATFSKGPTCP